MGAKTGIEWTDSTWSPIRYRVKADAAEIARAKGYTSLVGIAEKMAGRVGQHCEHVSPGCEHCYAESNNRRCLPGNGTGLPYDRRSRDLVEPYIDEKVLLAPLKWGPVVEHSAACELAWEAIRALTDSRRPKCGCSPRPRRIFVENQSDLFAEWVPDEMLDRVFAVMALCPQHIFQVLTKRPERMLAYFTHDEGFGRWGYIEGDARKIADELKSAVPAGTTLAVWGGKNLPNLWLGVSVENQKAADERVPLLLQTPAAVRYISGEPLLGLVQIPEYLPNKLWNGLPSWKQPEIDWVICGGESGPGARAMHPDWARGLRDQCQAAGVPYFFKQWGEWKNGSEPGKRDRVVLNDGRVLATSEEADEETRLHWNDFKPCMMAPVGKPGAVLDGREWQQFPGVRG